MENESSRTNRLEAIEKKLSAAMDPLSIPETSEMHHLKSFQCATLTQLRSLKAKLQAEGTVSCSSNDLEKENEMLREKVSKLEYRISHLLRHM